MISKEILEILIETLQKELKIERQSLKIMSAYIKSSTDSGRLEIVIYQGSEKIRKIEEGLTWLINQRDNFSNPINEVEGIFGKPYNETQ